MPYHKLNAHAHSTTSDGKLAIADIDDIAKDWGGLIAVTDHNTVRAHEEFESSAILPGIEVKVSEEDGGVDILLYHTRRELIDFFERIIKPNLADSTNPHVRIFGPTKLSILTLLEEAKDAGCEIIIPHYYHGEGISNLPKHLQHTIAQRYRPIVEYNGRLRRGANFHANLFAIRHGLPTIATADSHLPGQYTSSFTMIPLPSNVTPTIHTLLNTLRRHPKRCKKHLEYPSIWDALALVLNALRTQGVQAITDYIKRKVKNCCR